MSTENTPVTAAQSLFTFYDIESLSNVFTMCAYTPSPDGLNTLEVFYLVDDPAVAALVDTNDLDAAVVASNPGLPDVFTTHWNLAGWEANMRLAQLLGLSDAIPVGDRDQPSSYPPDVRPVCDTDPEYDPTRHPFLAGYNSANYDTTMLALYLDEVFFELAEYRTHLREANRQLTKCKTAGNHGDAQAMMTAVQARPPRFRPTTARQMREHNNELFSEEYIDYMPGYLDWGSPRYKIRQSMMHSGRHLDVARLNEAVQTVGLKRLLGMLGHQIKESDKLGHDSHITSVEDLYELLAYNVSDCLGLSQLFEHPTYASGFDLKAALLAQWPETVRGRRGQLRLDRLTIDASSAKFVGRILSPFGSLSDIETVSFNYPHPAVAAERGIPQVNVLDECVAFFESEVAPDRDTNPVQAQAHRQFMEVVTYYRSIEGRNFNDSEEYTNKYNQRVHELPAIKKTPNNLPYFHADGSPSNCFATFSYGGIHGAEYDEEAYLADRAEWDKQVAMIALAKYLFPDPRDFVAEAKLQRDRITLPDGSIVDKQLVLYGSKPDTVKFRKPKKGDVEQNEQLARAQAATDDPVALLATLRDPQQALDVSVYHAVRGPVTIVGKSVLAKTTQDGAEYREQPSGRNPEVFTMVDPEGTKGETNRSTKLNPRYDKTSAGQVIHEDFTSYYPNLLRNMRAFYNPELGEDRYAKIFFDKERYGQQMKDPSISSTERTRLNTLRDGTKLILNSASGAGDAAHKNPIRMNNQIISMRIMGQLFSWRIGQAQTAAGARIISTNTDGLYSVVNLEGFTAEINDRVLAEQSAAIGIDIEPEPLFLISKDSNNRLELGAPKTEPDLIKPSAVIRTDGGFNLDQLEIAAAGGSTLACHRGPRPDKRLAHPAVIDHTLARYLRTIACGGEAAFSEDFDPELGKILLLQALDLDQPVRTATLFQNIIAASRGSITYPFAADPIPRDVEEFEITGARALQMINRVFIVADDTPDAVSLHNAGAWKVSPASQEKRAKEGLPAVERFNPIAKKILFQQGWAVDARTLSQNPGMTLVPPDQDVVTRKINSVDPTWSMSIINDDLHTVDPARMQQLLASLDLGVYLQMLERTYTNNWKNA